MAKNTILIYCGCNCGGIEVASQKQADELDKNGCPVCKRRKELFEIQLDAELKAKILVDELRVLTLTDEEREQKRTMIDNYAADYLGARKEQRELNQIKKLSDKDKPFKKEVPVEPKQDQSESPVAKVGEK